MMNNDESNETKPLINNKIQPRRNSHFKRILKLTITVTDIAFPILITNATTTLNNFFGASIASKIRPELISSAASSVIFPMQISLIVVSSAPLFAIPIVMQKHIRNAFITSIDNVAAGFLKLCQQSDFKNALIKEFKFENNIEINQELIKKAILNRLSDKQTDHELENLLNKIKKEYNVSYSNEIYSYKNEHNLLVGQTIMQGMKLSLLLSFAPSIISFFCGDIFKILGTPQDVIELINNYFGVFSFVLPTQLLAFSMQQTSIGLSENKLLIASSVLNTMSTLISGYIIANGTFGFFNPGNSGVAYGFLIGGIMRILMYGLSFYRGNFKQYNIYRLENIKNNAILKDIFKTGWPFGLQLFSELLAINMLAVIANHTTRKIYNLNILNVMNQYNLFSVIIPIGLSEACAVLISRSYERKEFEKIRSIGNMSIVIGLFYNVILLALSIIFPKPLASIFMDVTQISGKGLSNNLLALFLIVFSGLTFNSIRDIVTGALRPLGIVRTPMYTSYGALWLIGLPLAYFMSIPLKMDIGGILLGYYIGVLAGAIFLLSKWYLESDSRKITNILGSTKIDKLEETKNDSLTSKWFNFFKNTNSTTDSEETINYPKPQINRTWKCTII